METLEDVIRKKGSKYCVLSEKKNKKGQRKNLGCSSTKAGAHKRLGQVEYFKRQKG
jgi:hypothetical protein